MGRCATTLVKQRETLRFISMDQHVVAGKGTAWTSSSARSASPTPGYDWHGESRP